MSRSTKQSRLRTQSFPRVSGDEPHGDQGHESIEEFSPRERG